MSPLGLPKRGEHHPVDDLVWLFEQDRKQFYACTRCRMQPVTSDHRCEAKRRGSRGRKQLGQAKRERIFARDGNRCLHCGATKLLTIDHIVPRSQGGTHDEDNLQTLCQPCHRKKDSMPSTKRAKRPITKTPRALQRDYPPSP